MSAATRKGAKARKRRRERDPSQEAVYRWEETWRAWTKNTISLVDCRRAIRAACAKYKVKPPVVRQHRQNAPSWCLCESEVISLQAVARSTTGGGKNYPTALHEAAHFIAYKKFGLRIQDHGPTFLGIFMWLLEAAQVAPPIALHASARAEGLKWRRLSPEKCHKRSLPN